MAGQLPDFPGTVQRGSRKRAAIRQVQEWLCLHGLGLVIDGDFGPATAFALAEFRDRAGLPARSTVDRACWDALLAPMAKALRPDSGRGSLRRAVLRIARRHRRAQPREVGGQNRGPWVRLYMDGNEGDAWPWCAGFVSLVLRQACAASGRPLPIQPSFSCDLLAASAKAEDRFLPATRAPGSAKPGDLFLVRRTSSDWTHTGIIARVEGRVMLTIEGNTNDSGSREGVEVCERIRSFRSNDVVQLG